MKKYLLCLLALAFTALAFTAAHADGYDLAVRNTKLLPAFSGSADSALDKLVIYDASDDKWKTVAATNAQAKTGRVDITICGDGTTINNNTVYYGPSMVPVANAIRTCNTAQAGSTTEATADTPALDNTAIQVLSMDCLTADPGAAGVTFALRNNAAATVPSVTCTAANTKLGCTANVQTTTVIAAGNPIAIAASSTGDQGTTPFACTIHAAY